MNKYYFKVENGYVLVICENATEAYALFKVRHNNEKFEMFSKYNWRLNPDVQGLDRIETIEVRTHDYLSYMPK